MAAGSTAKILKIWMFICVFWREILDFIVLEGETMVTLTQPPLQIGDVHKQMKFHMDGAVLPLTPRVKIDDSGKNRRN